MPRATIDDCKVIPLPRISGPQGNLTFLESGRNIPFVCKRVFYLFDVPAGQSRGGHAHTELHPLMIALNGGFDVLVDDGERRRTTRLDNPWEGLYVPPMIWTAESNFDRGTVCLVLASQFYEEAEYMRDYTACLVAVETQRPRRADRATHTEGVLQTPAALL
jgi:hypothetical protein